MFNRKKPLVNLRGVHLDLKGLPPTEKRLHEMLEIMALARINCVLVEWEDTYPWSKYPELKNETAYSQAAVTKFLDRAEKLSIEVIPLVQCFGHLETVLSKKRFAGLRENPANMSELCPSKEESRQLIKDLIKDILKTHQGRIRYLHLGGDEAFIMGSCPECKKIVEKEGRAALYLKQVSPLLEYVGEKGIQPILWFDMMCKWSAGETKKLQGKTDLMAWAYGPVLSSRAINTIPRFCEAGISVWGASAFKGADGNMAELPDMGQRADNILAWLEVFRESELKGIVATGWSRYNSFMSPCESLEASLDSLVVSGCAMWDGSLPAGYIEEARKFLNAGKMKKLAGQSFKRCLEACTAVDMWKRSMINILCQIGPRPAFLSGEKERKNPHENDAICRLIEKTLEEGLKVLETWVKVHKGLIPYMWLEYYKESRYRHLESYAKTLMKKLR
ncbi:MAG TPA: family 20 glycosylhydrolase [bacterium]|nr:family 20 glycosylhydrolase [bacterium]